MPAAVKKLIAAHDAAWEAWSAAEQAQLDAQANLDAAPQKDKDLLTEAAAALEPDPGTPTEDTARRAAEYAEAVARQAAAKVEALVLQIQEALPQHEANLIKQACTLEREAIATRVRLMAEAQASVAQATAGGRTIGSRANWLLDQLGQPIDYRISCHPNEVQWLATWQVENHGALTALDVLDGLPPVPTY